MTASGLVHPPTRATEAPAVRLLTCRIKNLLESTIAHLWSLTPTSLLWFGAIMANHPPTQPWNNRVVRSLSIMRPHETLWTIGTFFSFYSRYRFSRPRICSGEPWCPARSSRLGYMIGRLCVLELKMLRFYPKIWLEGVGPSSFSLRRKSRIS